VAWMMQLSSAVRAAAQWAAATVEADKVLVF
jgi:hypothetical protein